MSIYITPPLSAVDFNLTIYTQPSTVYPEMALSTYSVPLLSAVDFSIVSYTPSIFSGINFELLRVHNEVLMIICNC